MSKKKKKIRCNKEMKKNSIYNFKSINRKNNMIFKAFT